MNRARRKRRVRARVTYRGYGNLIENGTTFAIIHDTEDLFQPYDVIHKGKNTELSIISNPDREGYRIVKGSAGTVVASFRNRQDAIKTAKFLLRRNKGSKRGVALPRGL